MKSKARLGRRSALQKKKWPRTQTPRKMFESNKYCRVSLSFFLIPSTTKTTKYPFTYLLYWMKRKEVDNHERKQNKQRIRGMTYSAWCVFFSVTTFWPIGQGTSWRSVEVLTVCRFAFLWLYLFGLGFPLSNSFPPSSPPPLSLVHGTMYSI